MGKAAKPGAKQTIGSMTDQMRRFALEYTVDFNGKSAAIRAGYSEKTATVAASKLLAREDVQELVRTSIKRLEEKTEINAERVLREAWGIATADVNELVEFRRRCCRHCYGIDYGYQRTVQEMNADRRQYQKELRACKNQEQIDQLGEFDERGGIGYDARRAPVSDCTSCWGDGVGDAYFKPTASLSPEARALYAGVSIGNTTKMLLVDKLGAMEKLFKHLNLYKAEIKEQADALGEFLQKVQGDHARLQIGKPAPAAPAAPAPAAGKKPGKKWGLA